MRFGEMFPKEPSISQILWRLRAGVAAGRFSEETPLVDALAQILDMDSLDKVELEMAFEEIKPAIRSVRDFLSRVDRTTEEKELAINK